jgi:predicted RNA-binding Zn ribbon-like protein
MLGEVSASRISTAELEMQAAPAVAAATGGGWGWHLHVTAHDAALEHRIAAQVGFAVADLVRLRETGRLRHCEAPDCDAVFVDLSKNRSRRYCDTGNCGNRRTWRRTASGAPRGRGATADPPRGPRRGTADRCP